MQSTDENAHADYVFALYASHGWFDGRHGAAGANVTPEVRYLERHSNFVALRYSSDARVSTGYGTPRYFYDLDRAAPQMSGHDSRLSTIPYVAYNNPIAYYELAAFAMAVADRFHNGSIVLRFFAARSVGIACLLGTLLFVFGTTRRLAYDDRTSLFLTFAYGAMPLTSWVFGYIQPDVLTALLTNAFLYFVVRFRFERASRWASLALFVVIATYFVKWPYALVLTLVLLAAWIARAVSAEIVDRRRAVASAVTVIVGSVCAWFCSTHLTPVGILVAPRGAGVQSTSPDFAAFGWVKLASSSLADVYLPLHADGGFSSFWIMFGDLVSPYLAEGATRTIITAALSVLSFSTLLFVIRSQMIVITRIARVQTKRAAIATALFLDEPVFLLYVLWLGLLIAACLATNGTNYIEGRYFVPVLLPTMLLSVRYVPKFIRNHARILQRLGVGFWVIYSLTFAPIALYAMERRFYDPTSTTAAFKNLGTVARGRDGTRIEDGSTIAPRTPIRITAYVIPFSDRMPDMMWLKLDGKVAARVRNPSRMRNLGGYFELIYVFPGSFLPHRGSHVFETSTSLAGTVGAISRTSITTR